MGVWSFQLARPKSCSASSKMITPSKDAGLFLEDNPEVERLTPRFNSGNELRHETFRGVTRQLEIDAVGV